MQTLSDVHQTLSPDLPDTVPAWQSVQDLNEALMAQPVKADANQTFAAHTAFVDAVMALLQDEGSRTKSVVVIRPATL